MAGIPLMVTLTDRIFFLLAKDPSSELLSSIKAELPKEAHIEHVLSQLADYIAIAERSRTGALTISGHARTKEELKIAHQAVLQQISDIVRCGYAKGTGSNPELVGTFAKPIVKVEDHLGFIRVLFITRQAGLHDRRRAVKLFTTN